MACKEPVMSKESSLHIAIVWEMSETKLTGRGSFRSKAFKERLQDSDLTKASVAKSDNMLV